MGPFLGADIDLAVIAETASRSLPEDTWDMPPVVAIVLAHEEAISVQGFPLPAWFWEDRHPYEVLGTLTEMMRKEPITGPPDPHATPVGIMLGVEAYSAHVPPGTSREDAEAFGLWCESHSIADHPWGRESRDIFVVGFDGSFHHCNHPRGTQHHEASSYRYLDDWPSGRLTDALRGFTLAVKDALA